MLVERLALVEPARVACLLVLVFLVELPVIRWPCGRAAAPAGPPDRATGGDHQRGKANPSGPGGRAPERLRCGRGCSWSARRVLVERLALVEPGRVACLLVPVPVFLVELAGPDLAGLPVIR